MPGQSVMNSPRFQSKCIVIVNCDLFFHYCNAKEISLYYIVVMQNVLQNMNLFVIAHLYWWDDVFKVNEWCLIDCFRCKCRVSTQVMVLHFPLKKFSSCSRLLKALSTIFFAIQNSYINLNFVPDGDTVLLVSDAASNICSLFSM